MRSLLAIVLLLLLGLATGDLHAQPSPPPGAVESAKTVTLGGDAIFGQDATSGDGWIEIVAHVQNIASVPVKGTLELSSAVVSHAPGETMFSARAPFSVPAGSQAVVHMPAHNVAFYAPTVVLRATSESGKVLAETTVTVNGASGPMLVDVSPTPRLASVLRGVPVYPSWVPFTTPYAGSASPPATFTMSVGSPRFDATTGDPILPDRAAGYAPASTVLARSEMLAKLEGGTLEALVNWVLSGGTLSVVISRPEDLRGAIITTLVGGTVTASPLPAKLPPPPSPAQGDHDGDDDPPRSPRTPRQTYDAGADPTPIQYRAPPRAGAPKPPPATPLPAVAEKLTGYAGGNLRPSLFGSSAQYGLGEVHLLAFDPTSTPGLDDPWVHARVIDLTVRAFERHAAHAFPHGAGERRGNDLQEIRRTLDPNENFRPALAISAIVLVLYSIIVGPLTFHRAAKRGRPLDPLLWAPVWSAVALGIIVVVGLAGKGWRGRARHIALLESGAGISRGPIHRFRGFFSSGTRSLTIRGSDRGAVLDIAATDSRGSGDDRGSLLRLDRNGASIENLTALPWQTVVVTEHGFFDTKQGITVLPATDGSVDVVNRTGRDLKNVFVHVPGQGMHYFAGLKDDGSLHASAGVLAASATKRARATVGTRAVHALDLSAIRTHAGDDAARAWSALALAAGTAVDWLPDNDPVVMGELEGGERTASDSGLSVDGDRLLVRIVGMGGTK